MVVIRRTLTVVIAALLVAPQLVDALKVVSMPMTRRERMPDLEKRASPSTIFAPLANNVKFGAYTIDVAIGTPPQPISLQLDTGSSDLWMFAPGVCDQDCTGGTFDSSKSSTYKLIGANEFEIQYDTPGSDVLGDYITDNCKVGDITLDTLIMAVAKTAAKTFFGIMGIGFDTDESSDTGGANSIIYPNIIDVMVNQSLINTRAYSLYLDDLTSQSGSIIFGGYDTEKFIGTLVDLKIQPDQNGMYTSFTVAWTSLSVTADDKTTKLTSTTFPAPAVLDSGTTLMALPDDIAMELINKFGAELNEGIYVVLCDVAQGATLDFEFEGNTGKTISVGLNELLQPLNFTNGDPATDDNGNPICQFGISLSSTIGGDILLGDAFLRSAYVVYDLDNLAISIAQTNFGSTSSNIVEIKANGVGVGANGVSSSISVVSSVTATQTASNLSNGSGGSLTESAVVVTTTSSSIGQVATTTTSPTIAAPSSDTSISLSIVATSTNAIIVTAVMPSPEPSTSLSLPPTSKSAVIVTMITPTSHTSAAHSITINSKSITTSSHTSATPSVPITNSAPARTLFAFNRAPLATALVIITFTVMRAFCVTVLF